MSLQFFQIYGAIKSRIAGGGSGVFRTSNQDQGVVDGKTASLIGSKYQIGLRSPAPCICLTLVLITAAFYWPTLNFGFIDYDDPTNVSLNRYVISGLTWDSIKWAFRSVHGYYHPLTSLSLMLDSSVFGPIPEGYHLTNVILHCTCVGLIYGIATRITGAPWFSAIPTLVLALHPINVESVAWIAERRGLLCSVFYLSSVLVYLTHVRSHRSSCMLSVSILFILGMLTKPMIISLPIILLLLDYWPLRRLTVSSPKSWHERSVEKLPLFALAIAGAILCYWTQASSGAIVADLPLEIRASNAIRAYTFALGKAFWPTGLAAFYPYPQQSLPHSMVSAGILLTLTAGAIFAARRQPALLFGWSWFIVIMAPVVGAIKFGSAFIADRYMYLPLVGIVLALSWTAKACLARSNAFKAALALTSCLWFGWIVLLSYDQVRLWRNSETLFRATLNRTARNPLAHCVLASYLYNAKRFGEAEEEYLRALQLNPQHSLAWYNLGLTLIAVNRLSDAESCFQVAGRLSPSTKEAAINARRVRLTLEENSITKTKNKER